ncbi:MAG: hypothetical protein GF308_10840 [Candidatus Heimdallarchaeota archaeon]|nr:hypothetical protein [Candidatus Heimdallarchaeota archaeon]
MIFYRWLEDFSSEKVQKWLDGQEKYRKRIFSRIPKREKNYERIKEHLSLGTISILLKYGSKIFTLRRTTEDQRILCSK